MDNLMAIGDRSQKKKRNRVSSGGGYVRARTTESVTLGIIR